MLNFAYDVPVKLYSSNLLLMSLFLLIPDASALTRFFLLDEPSRLQGVWVPKFERRHLRIAAITLQAVVICSVLYNNIWGGYSYLKSNSFKNAPLYGIWNADSFTGPIGWRQLTIHVSGRLHVRDANGERASFRSTYDESKHTLKLSSPQSKQEGEFTYSQLDPQHLTLRGSLNGNQVVADFHRFDESRLLLTSRGFHWINEDPFNR